MTTDEHGTVVVTTCTYARPEQLRRTLAAVGQQAAEADVRTLLLVVDNDPSESARPVAQSMGAAYVVEPRRGVGNARNQALSVVRGLREPVLALVFFDDDQVPAPGWYRSFLQAHAWWPRAILSGPVQPDLDFDLPEWATDGWPWRRPDHDDGATMTMTGDGNVLLPRSVLQRDDCSYDPEFGLGMGQDTELFTRLRRAGVEIRHVSGAAALEDVPESRRGLDWLLRRAASSADAWATITRRGGRGARARVAAAVLIRAWRVAVPPLRRSAATAARRQVALMELRTLARRLR